VARKYRLSKKADSGLTKIWRDIYPDNPVAADALYLRVLQRIKLASEHPSMGSPHPEFGANARMLVEGNYKIVYVPAKDGILVTAIVHSRRLPANWL
jgi:toxin ParE1/3/4